MNITFQVLIVVVIFAISFYGYAKSRELIDTLTKDKTTK